MSRPLQALALALGAALLACSSGASEPTFVAPAATPGPAPSHAAAAQPIGQRVRLVFFMNPYGAPCQMQDRILHEMSADLSRVDVVYYKTNQPADLARFEEYGIRSLPQLLVTDATGRELRRATPGIQGPDQVRGLIAP
ncbi:MAG TPA: thioredoxin family protein [Anaeromyxobacter sp.]